jgi:DNA-binding response OmpR family regulator
MKQVNPKILVVDDDPRLRDLLVRYLTEQGFQVQALADARDLDKSCNATRRICWCWTLCFPEKTGSPCAGASASGETVPVIMLTAKGEDVDRIVGLEMGADDYLPKPFNPRELVAIHARSFAARPNGSRPARLEPMGRLCLDRIVWTWARES